MQETRLPRPLPDGATQTVCVCAAWIQNTNVRSAARDDPSGVPCVFCCSLLLFCCLTAYMLRKSRWKCDQSRGSRGRGKSFESLFPFFLRSRRNSCGWQRSKWRPRSSRLGNGPSTLWEFRAAVYFPHLKGPSRNHQLTGLNNNGRRFELEVELAVSVNDSVKTHLYFPA